MVCSGLLGKLDGLPVGLYRLGVLGFDVAINVRMAPNQLVADAVQHLGQAKMPPFAGYFAVEYQMQKKIAEFIGHARPISSINGIRELIGLL